MRVKPSTVPSCLYQLFRLLVWGIFSWHTVVPLVPTEHHLKAMALLSVVAYRVHPIMTTAYLSFNGCFQQNNAVCHKTLIISKLVGVVEWKLHIIDVQMAYLQQMWDAIISTWTKISEMFPAPCWLYAELGQFWRQRGCKLVLAVIQIKCT